MIEMAAGDTTACSTPNNLNQIARVVNSTGLKPTDTALLLSYLAGMQDELRLIREPEKPETEGGDDAP